MSTAKPLYSGAASAVTITIASLASNAYRQSAAVDNSANLYLDAVITGKIKSGASGTSATGFVTLYLYGYDGTQYSNNASGADAAFTPDLQANLLPLFTLAVQANATTYYFPYLSVAAAAGLLYLPQKWGLILFNGSGNALDTTAGNHALEYQGINTQIV